MPHLSRHRIGTITHYFGRIGVAAIKLTAGELRIGDQIHILGHTTDITQRVGSMQIEHESITSARIGDEVGLKVTDYVREGDAMYLMSLE